MREHIMSELKKMIDEAVLREIPRLPRLLERKDFKGVQEDSELVIGFMLEYFGDRLVEDEFTAPSDKYYGFLEALKKIASSNANARNANLVFKCLKVFYEMVFSVVPKPAKRR